jgi:hypothetical protein
VLQRTGPHAALPPVIGAYGITQLRRPSAAVVRPSFSAASMAEARRQRTQARRREVFMGLVISMVATLLLGMLPALHVFLYLHLALDALMVGYVAMLVHLKSLASERTAKVRYLPTRPQVVEPALLLRRTGN